ncbi:unnamed protein product [Medioppia subpectinata]|uniref:tRNA (guanine(9)-N(1))-methyltransferase n=1 Tax=Medioppia subpectinata TaxID=1979941 RepID=A0A7R9KU18_9ACAR|nr:unnamed protein product [Medioppia subpectinata]CAG2109850.1 unnamed protein product [Medioppia subpectinata]
METKCDNESNETVPQSDDTNGEPKQEMSKKQMKRLQRHQKWLDSRPEKRRQEKERKKLKAKRLREEGVEVMSRTALKKQYIPMSSSKCKVSVCIDCDFEDYMEEKDMKKLVKQIGRCYAFNRHSSAPVQLYITSVVSKVREVLTKCQPGFTNWDAVCLDSHWTQVFTDKSKIIYLTSDSEDVIPDPKDIVAANDYVFIIGGLVDHNKYKGLSVPYRQAVRHSVRSEG